MKERNAMVKPCDVSETVSFLFDVRTCSRSFSYTPNENMTVGYSIMCLHYIGWRCGAIRWVNNVNRIVYIICFEVGVK